MKFNFNEQKKSYSFWLSIASAIFLLVQAIGKPLGLNINEEIYMSIINAVLGIFVVLGILTYPNTTQDNENQNIKSEEEMENINISDRCFSQSVSRRLIDMDGYFGPLVADYTSSLYHDCCIEWTEYCNRFINDENKKRLSAIFREASRQELIFWQMAGGDDHE